MRSCKRAWIYLGLGLPQGKALARADDAPLAIALRAGDRVLLAGDALVWGLHAPLGRLAAGAGVQLEAVALSGSTVADWADAPWLPGLLDDYRPAAIVWALDPYADAAWSLRGRARAVGVRRICWLPPPGGIRRIGTVVVPDDELVVHPGMECTLPTAAGFAGWAGSAWYACAGVTPTGSM